MKGTRTFDEMQRVKVEMKSGTKQRVQEELVMSAPLTIDDLREELLCRLAEEGHATDQELVQDDAHRPPVDGLAVTFAQNHLGRYVLRSAKDLRTQHGH